MLPISQHVLKYQESCSDNIMIYECLSLHQCSPEYIFFLKGFFLF